MAKDIIIDPEWEKQNELRGAWSARPRRDEPEDLDPFGVDRPQESGVLEPDEPPFDPDPQPTAAPAPPEPEPDPFTEPEPETVSRTKQYIGMILSGSILTKAEVRNVYPYLIAVAVLMMAYIASVFRMQELHRREIQLTRQVKELRATSLELASQRMLYTRQSNIIEELEKRGIPLGEAVTPPKVVK